MYLRLYQDPEGVRGEGGISFYLSNLEMLKTMSLLSRWSLSTEAKRGRIEEVLRNSEWTEGLSERLRNAAVSWWNETKSL